MEDKVKTKEQLMSEMAGLRQRIAELESIVSTHESGEESFLSAQMTWVQVFQAIGQAALILDPQHGVIAANHAAEKATGCSEEEMRHKKCYEIFHGTGKPPDECPLQKMLISGHWETAEMEIELLGGIFLVSCTPVLDDAGNLESVIHVATDITESKQAEEALRESEERSRALFKSVPVPTYTWQKVGADFVLVDYNDTAYAITQGAVGDLVGAKASDMYLDAPEIQKELSQCLSEKKLIGRQVPYKYRFSGQQRYLDVKYSFVPPDFVLVHTEDITERRQAEQLLAESEEQFRTITEESLQGIIILQDGMVKYVNEAFANVVGYTPEEMLKWGPNEFEKAVYPEDRAFAIEQARRKQAGEPDVVPHYEYRLFTRTGKTKWVEQYSKTIEYGGRAADLATIIDVTERKRAEEALAINEARFRELFARMSSGVAVYEAIENGTDFVFRDFNQAGERMERVKKEDILGKKVTEAFPGIKEFGLFEVLQRVWKTGDPEYHPVSFYHDQRLTSWRENHVYRLPSGEIVAVYDDITFRKQAEEALQESEERYRSFVQNFPGIAYRSRMDFIPIFFHGAVEKVTGYAEKDFLEGKPRWDQIIHSADLARLFTEDEGKLHSILHYSYEREYRIIRKDGAIRWVQEVIQSAGGDSEGPAFVQGTIIDITERKLAEEALRESEEKYRVLFDSLVMGTFLNSLDGIISNVNKVGSLILGYDRPEDMVGKNIIDFYKKSEDRERLVADVRGKGTASFEVEMVRQDGATIVCRIASAIVTILGNEFLLTSVQDITDHHRTEEALRKSEEHFRTVAQTANDAIVSIDANTNIFFWNHAAEVIFGYSADEMLGKSLAYIIPAQFHDSFYNSFSNWDSSNMAMQLSKAPGRVIEMSGTRKDGTEFPAELSISEWYIEESRFFTTIVRDITERKKAEGALRESEANFRGIAERSFDGIITINREQQFVYVSPAITRIHGYQPEEMLHRTFWDFLPESELPHVQEAFRKVLNGFNVEALELQVISKDGTIITIEINASPIVVDGNTIGLQCIYRDITERKRTEEELRKEKEFSESLIDTAGALILGFSADGVITLFNKQSELTTGWKRGEVLGRNWLDTFVSESHKTLVG
ncbi:MAG: PAS domain S-box protein, partial [Chloroflexota bacterium]|nr:PAS domain S-box protein [Chloroflexota bacterium]